MYLELLVCLKQAVTMHQVGIIRRKDLVGRQGKKDRTMKQQNQCQSLKWLKRIPVHIGYYLSGFIDGEGSFNVSLRKRPDHRIGWQVVLMFNVSQRDRTILALLKRYLGCGKLYCRKDGVHYYVVTNYHMIQERVIPFFKRFPLLSAKSKKNFSLFCRITKMVNKGEHLTKKGLQEIIRLREELNKGRGRKRKHTIDNVYL